MAKRKEPKPTGPTFPVAFDFFGAPSYFDLMQYEGKSPSCFNGNVKVERYRVTFERVDEPDDLVRERLVALWRASDNHHHVGPLRAKAAKYGLKLDMNDWGKDRRRDSPLGEKP
jgi:hypothetical protein